MTDYYPNLTVGVVKEIKGTSVIIRMTDKTSQLFHFYRGKKYSGVMIGTYLGIQRGRYTIVGKVEKEYAYDQFQDIEKQEFSKERFVREVEVKIIGSFLNGKFEQGIIAFPQIFNNAILLSKDLHEKIFEEEKTPSLPLLPFGKVWPDNYKINLHWENLFNTHIAIFGNTGSGKSNTLAKIYYELFQLNEKKSINVGESKFIIFDFNGEYINEKTISSDKKIYNLSNLDSNEKSDKIEIPRSYFWNVEMLSIIFGATEQTQKPFLKRVINHYIHNNKNENLNKDINYHLKMAFKNVYMSPNRDSLNLLKHLIDLLGLRNNDVSEWIDKTVYNSTKQDFYSELSIDEWNGKYWNPSEEAINKEIEKINVNSKIRDKYDRNSINYLKIAIYLNMIFELKYHRIQYDHIAPLLQRIETKLKDLESLIKISENDNKLFNDKNLNIVSLKYVNEDMKLIIPLVVSKTLYAHNKEFNKNKDYIVNLIIDEAHNILSNKSNNESVKWKDYRLEVFEEIIKEGRKFNFYITIASQRPADISPTIISQIHNYFIHRLVNENDLKMLDNSMTTLDIVSKENIPNLAPGQLICTGISFKIPLIIEVEKLSSENAPESESANLENIWISKKD